MRPTWTVPLLLLTLALSLVSVRWSSGHPAGGGAQDAYPDLYRSRLAAFAAAQQALLATVQQQDPATDDGRAAIRHGIQEARARMKAMDLWLRYLEPLAYKRINGPLPVEWETEVFEKYEKPYRREGAGLTLAELYLDEPGVRRDSLLQLVRASLAATQVFAADSITRRLATPDHFFLGERLFLLDLAAIYTTAFECPDTGRVVPELRAMLKEVEGIHDAFNASFPRTPLPAAYRERYRAAIAFVDAQPDGFSRFDRFRFLRDHVGPLFTLVQGLIDAYGVRSRSYMDYALNRQARTIFSKDLYTGQDVKGLFRRVSDPAVLAEIERLGRLLFFDPLLSGNGRRSCASCHAPGMCFTDTLAATPIAFDHSGTLPRNAPSLVNADLNHLLMQDGRHISLQAQTRDVLTDPLEMGGDAAEVLRQVMACPDYERGFEALLAYTPQEPAVTLEHVLSAITFYYTRFSGYRSPFDRAMDEGAALAPDVVQGFNLFMGKAQCATCHFVPQFNGVKPPYIGSEFEVIGVPEQPAYASLSPDLGRYAVNPAVETAHAFRTGSLRNIARTAPYMHNGVFRSLREVIDLYDTGGGAGHGLDVPNQTLGPDPLHLSEQEKEQLEAFLRALTEDLPPILPPTALPRSRNKALDTRTIGGDY